MSGNYFGHKDLIVERDALQDRAEKAEARVGHLEAECAKLRRLVSEAYRDGFAAGCFPNANVDDAWPQSMTFADLNEMPDRRRRAEDRLAEAEVARQFREKYDNERNAELAALRQKLAQAENRERLALTEIKTLKDEKAALEARFALAAEIVKVAGELRALDKRGTTARIEEYRPVCQHLDALLAKWKEAK